jgi:hypothetical protein
MDLLMATDLFAFYLLKIFFREAKNWQKNLKNAAIALSIYQGVASDSGVGHGLSSSTVVSGVAVGYN